MRQLTRYFAILVSTLLIVACSFWADTYDSHSKTIRLSDYKGKWILINYWASWCTACLSEIPLLNELYEHHPQQVVVLGISFDPLTNQEINAFGTKYKVSYPLAANFPIRKYADESAEVLPVTFIIDPKGELEKIVKGPLDEKELHKDLGLSITNEPNKEPKKAA